MNGHLHCLFILLPFRSLSSSEIDFLKEDFQAGRQLESIIRDSPKESPLTIQADVSTPRYNRSITQNGTGRINESTCDLLPEQRPITSFPLRQKFIMADVHHEQSVTTKFPDPPPSFLILPRYHTKQTLTGTSYSLSSQNRSPDISGRSGGTTSRLVPTSISLDSSRVNSLQPSPHAPAYSKTSLSAGGTPTYEPVNYLPSIPVSGSAFSSDTSLSPRSGNSSNSGSCERLTPRSARKKFFEDQGSLASPTSLSERSESCEGMDEDGKSMEKPTVVGTKRVLFKHGESEDDVIGQLIEETKPRQLTQSISIDERTTHSITKQKNTDSSKKSKPEKPKRKVVRRSQSVDSSVKNSVAKAGITAMSTGAPSNTKAVELFATMRRKIRKTLKRSSSMTDDEKVSPVKEVPSSESISPVAPSATQTTSGQTSGMVYRPSTHVHKPAIGVQTHQGTIEQTTQPIDQSVPPPTPPISAMSRRELPEVRNVLK